MFQLPRVLSMFHLLRVEPIERLLTVVESFLQGVASSRHVLSAGSSQRHELRPEVETTGSGGVAALKHGQAHKETINEALERALWAGVAYFDDGFFTRKLCEKKMEDLL